MANDNLLAGLAGLLSGVKESLVPAIQARQKYSLESALQDRMLKAEQAMRTQEQGNKFFMDMELANRDIKAKSDLERQKSSEMTKVPSALIPLFKGQEEVPTSAFPSSVSALSGLQKEKDKMEKKKGLTQKDKDRLTELESVKGDVEELFNKAEHIAPAAVGSGASLISKIPIIGKTISPAAHDYNDFLFSTAANYTKALTGGAPRSNLIVQKEADQMNVIGYPKKFREGKKKLALDRIQRRIDAIKKGLPEPRYEFDPKNSSLPELGVGQVPPVSDKTIQEHIKNMPPGTEFLGYE